MRQGISINDIESVMNNIIDSYQHIESARVRALQFGNREKITVAQIERIQAQLAHVVGCATHLSQLLADTAGDIHAEDYAFQNNPVWNQKINAVVTLPYGYYGSERHYTHVYHDGANSPAIMHVGTETECEMMHDKCMAHLKENFHRVKDSNGCAVYMRKASAE